MDANTKILLTAACVVLMALRSFGQYGNRYVQRGFAQDFDGFDQGKYSAGHVHPYSPTNQGQGYNLGWNGYQGAGNVFNPYQKLGYGGYQNQGYGGGLGFADGAQLFGVQQQPANFIGNQRFRV